MSSEPDLPDNLLYKKTQAAESNKNAILEVLKKELSSNVTVLEIGSGTGQHAATFCSCLPTIDWIPSDLNSESFESIASWKKVVSAENMEPPRLIDAASPNWNIGNVNRISAIVAINVIHISSFDVTLGILNGANKYLDKGGVLYFYGPFFQNNVEPTESNKVFDQYLRNQNEYWGIRTLDEIEVLAKDRGLHLDKTIEMPKNNLSVIFQKN